MKILSAEETRKADAFTIENEPVKSIDLMERAAKAFVKIFIKKYSPAHPVLVVCGTGNNGGDGMAVSRILIKKGYKVGTVALNYKKGKGSDDFITNNKRLSKLIKIKAIKRSDDMPPISPDHVVIDAIFGSGLSRPVEGLYAEIIGIINQSSSRIVSIDIASGLFADQPVTEGAIIEPELTITFQMPKVAFFIPENEKYTGQFIVADIGLDKNFINACEDSNFFTDKEALTGKMLSRNAFSHKGNFGKALLISGGKGKMGAAVLGARACLRSGAGLVTVHVPACGYEIIQSAIPEAMASVDQNMDCITDVPGIESYDAVGAGPGLGLGQETVAMIKKLIENYDGPIVFDADALNIFGKNKSLLRKLPPKSILTPHLKEFERMAGSCNTHFDRLEKQKAFSKKHNVIVVLKGAYTAVTNTEGQTFFNSTGNPGMATGGSGDVLTGMISGLLAQAYSPEDAALLGVFIHGLAGDLAAKKTGQEGMIAGDIINKIPEATKKCKKYFL